MTVHRGDSECLSDGRECGYYGELAIAGELADVVPVLRRPQVHRWDVGLGVGAADSGKLAAVWREADPRGIVGARSKRYTENVVSIIERLHDKAEVPCGKRNAFASRVDSRGVTVIWQTGFQTYRLFRRIEIETTLREAPGNKLAAIG
jgi:hypothetical protein